MDRFRSINCFLVGATLSALLLSGCGSGDQVADAVGKMNSNNLVRVASCYAMFQQRTDNYKGPKNMEEFKAFLNKPEYAPALEMMGVDPANIDATFISERDDEEILVRWNVRGSQRGCYEPVAFEKTGVDGVRMVGFANGTFEEVDNEQTYNDMMAGKAKAEDSRVDAALPKFDKNGNKIN